MLIFRPRSVCSLKIIFFFFFLSKSVHNLAEVHASFRKSSCSLVLLRHRDQREEKSGAQVMVNI